MSEDSEAAEGQVSDSINVGEELVYAVQEAIDDWVAAEDVPIRRVEDQIIADEDELVKNICVMTVLAVDEAAE
jgi:hypothetical protein